MSHGDDARDVLLDGLVFTGAEQADVQDGVDIVRADLYQCCGFFSLGCSRDAPSGKPTTTPTGIPVPASSE